MIVCHRHAPKVAQGGQLQLSSLIISGAGFGCNQHNVPQVLNATKSFSTWAVQALLPLHCWLLQC